MKSTKGPLKMQAPQHDSLGRVRQITRTWSSSWMAGEPGKAVSRLGMFGGQGKNFLLSVAARFKSAAGH